MAQASRAKAVPAGSETSFGELLRAFRKAAGLTQDQLAERAGYSTVYVSMLERGQRLPLPATAEIFAVALDLGSRDRAALKSTSRPHVGGERRSSPLVGRERELQAIERHLQGEGPPVLLLAGEPGIGKTRLLREAGMRAGRYGLHALEGGCLRRGGEEPFTPILQALQGHIRTQAEGRLREELAGCAWLVRLLPELAGGPIEPLPPWTIPPEQERRLMDDAVVRFLGNVAGPRGVLLVLDDLQWAASDALDLLRLLAHAPGRVRIIGAYRENETGSRHPTGTPRASAWVTFLADLAHARLLTHQTLGPLDDQEAGRLLDVLLEDAGSGDPGLREWVLSRVDGVPFFVVSCAQVLRTGAMHQAVPWDLAQSIRQRLTALPEPARELLTRASVAGRRIPHALLVALGGQHEDALLEGLDVACRARLLEEVEGGAYQFTHDVIREVIEAELGAARRTVLHRQIAEALERQGGPVEALAYHYARSTDSHKAALYLERAAEAATKQHANATAEGYLRELVDRLDGLGRSGEAARAREKLGQILTTVARYADALAVLEQAAREYRRLGDAEGEARAVAQIGHVHYLRGTAEEGIARLAMLREQLEGGPASHALAALNTALAPLFLARSRYREQLQAAERAAEIARMLEDDRLLVEAEVWRGCALNQLGRLADGRQVLEACVPLADAAGDLAGMVHALNDLGFLYEIAGEFARSRVHKQRALEVAERVGDPTAIANMSFRCGQNAFLSGDWSAAQQFFERSLALARRVDASSILAYPLFGLGLLALARGDGDSVVLCAEECLAIAGKTADAQMLRAGQTLLAEHDLQEGRPADARARLQALEPDDEGLDLHSVVPTLAEACLRMGKPDDAQQCIENGLRKAAASHSQVGLVDMLRVKALALIERERWDEAARLLDEALHIARAMPYPYAVARLLTVYSLLHRQTGQEHEARRKFDEAYGILRRLGAERQTRPPEKGTRPAASRPWSQVHAGDR